MFFNPHTSTNEKFSSPFVNNKNSSTIASSNEKNHVKEVEKEEEPFSLKNPETGAIDPSNVRLSSAGLFNAYAQNGVDQALYKKQDLVEWFENTMKIFESPQMVTLKSFFNCFKEVIDDFPNLSSFSKELKDDSDTLLKDIDAFQLLEILKQDLTDSLSYEITRIFSVRQAENAKMLRLKNEEKAEVEEQCQKLMKETGVSPTSSNIKAEMAAASWRYMINNLPSLFNDYTFFNKSIPLWQKSNPSESEWTKQLLSSIDDTTSPYSRLPSHIKSGLKTYLTSYKKNADYAEHIKLQNSLIGKPQITRCGNSGLKVLRVTGRYLSLGGLFTLPELKDLKGIDEIQILATETMFLDKNMNDGRFQGMNIVITGKIIDVTAAVVIDTSGHDALQHAEKKARDGVSFGYSSRGYDGENGKPGNPGESAGHVHIQAGEIKGAQRLKVIANGGKGGDGQHGGVGDKGQDGLDGEDADYYSDGSSHHAFQDFHIRRGTSGTLGQPGGKGGDAGAAGQGGHAGLVNVRDGLHDYVSRKTINLSAVDGKDGASGEPGKGGEAGIDGLRGLDSIVVFRGGWTFQPDIRLKGWDVYARLINRGFWTKNTYDAFARVPEHVVRSKSRARTRANGKVGMRARHKNSAKQKAVINFSTLLQQCPEVSTSFISRDSNQLNQKLGTLFVLGECRQGLDKDIQHFEKEKNILSEKLKKIEEITQSIAKNAIQQRMTQRQSVAQMADARPSRMPQNEKERALPSFSFFTPSSNKEKSKSTAFQRLTKTVFKHMQGSLGWPQAIALISIRLENDLEKIKNVCPNLKISQDEVYVSLEKLVEASSKEKNLSSEDLTTWLYEMSIWHVTEPSHIEKILHYKRGLFQSLLDNPKFLTDNEHNGLKFALSFMRLDPPQLDDLCTIGKTNSNILISLDQYYQDTFYKRGKEAVLSRKEQLTPEGKININGVLNNIFFELERPQQGLGYAESVKIMGMLIREMEQLSHDLPSLRAKLFELLKLARVKTKEEVEETVNNEKPFEKKKSNEIPKDENYFLELANLPFSSNIYDFGSEDYLEAKKVLIDFIVKRKINSDWCIIFENFWKKLDKMQYLPPLEEVNYLFSLMGSREDVSKLATELKSEDLSNWLSKILLGNIREQLNHFLLKKLTDDTNPLFDKLNQKISKLSQQPNILNIFYQKLTSEVKLFDSKLSISINELTEILSSFEPLHTSFDNSDFHFTLLQTPLPGWSKVLRERFFQETLFDLGQINHKDQKRCLFLLCKLEENLGKEIINCLLKCIQKEKDSVDYTILADILIQARYQQLTLDNNSLSLLENAKFETWFSLLLDFHKKETEKTRDLETLLSIMQKEAANKEMKMLLPEGNNKPLVVRQIERIQYHLNYLISDSLTNMLFKDKEYKPACCLKPINQWTEKDIYKWSKAFRKQENKDKLVNEHLCEIIAVISQAVYLEKKFSPHDVQYIALLTAFQGSHDAQKMISQIATGQGKTITGTMLALLQVFSGKGVDFVTSSSVLAEETEEEIKSIARIFGFTTACNTECHDGPYALELILGEPSKAQIEQICKNKGIAVIKKGEEYFLGFSRIADGIFIESAIELSEWPELKRKLTETPFQSHKCTDKDGLHEEVFKIVRSWNIQEGILLSPDETAKLQENYRADILCGDLQSFMRAHLLTEFYGKNITQKNRSSFMIMDEVDRLLDEMGDILYLSHDIPDMHHLNNLLTTIWLSIHNISSPEDTEENIDGLTKYFLDQLSPGDCATAEVLEGKILIPSHLEAFVRRRLLTWVKSAYIAKNGLSSDGEYIIAQMDEGEDKGVYLIDRDTGVASRNKELANAVHQFLRLKHQDWPKPLSLKSIYCDPISFLMKNYQNGFFGMTGTLGSEQDCRFFEKLFHINKRCIVPRHELLDLEVDPPILVSSFDEQMEETAKKVQELACGESKQPVLIMCETIAEAKAMAEFLKKKMPDASVYKRIHSFELFNKGSKKDPIKSGDVIVTTPLSARGTDFKLDTEAEKQKLCLIKLGVHKHERADKQVDGRTGRKGLPGRLIHILCPQHGESSLEEMQARRDLEQELNLDQIRKKDLHQNRINQDLFESFGELSKQIDEIIRAQDGNWHWTEGYLERQRAALRTHWAFWLDEVEQNMEATGICDGDALNADFQLFRKKMLTIAEEKGRIKFITGAGEITQLGTFFALEIQDSSLALECFDKVIQDFYPFAGQALYYKAFVILNAAKPDNFKARKEAVRYLKRAASLFRKEIQRLQDPAAKMVALDEVIRKTGQALQHSQFKKTVNGLIQALSVHLSSIEKMIGSITEPSFFVTEYRDKKEAKTLFRGLVEIGNEKDKKHRNGGIKGYRISGKVSITDDKRLEIGLINGYRKEVKFPSDFKDFKDKIIDMIHLRQKGNRKSRTLSYKQYCKLVFGEKEASAEEAKKMLMKSTWDFLQNENVISQPSFVHSRKKKLKMDNPLGCYSDEAWTSAAGLLRILGDIELHTDGIETLSERGRIPMEVLSLFRHTLKFDQTIRVDKKPVRWSWFATAALFWAALQTAAGVFLAYPPLIYQGINDVSHLAIASITGDISWENYRKYKVMGVAIGALVVAINPAVNHAINSANKFVQNINQLLGRVGQNINSPLPKTFFTTTTNILQQTNGALIYSLKLVNAVPIKEVINHPIKLALAQTATTVTMHYLASTFCQNDIDQNARKTLGSKIQICVEGVSKEIKNTCMAILEYSESLEKAEQTIQYVFENTLRERIQERHNPWGIDNSIFIKPVGKFVTSAIYATTGNQTLANVLDFCVDNYEKIGAVSQAVFEAKKVMEDVHANLTNRMIKLRSTKREERTKQKELTNKTKENFAKFVNEEILKLRSKIGNDTLTGLGNAFIQPLVSWSYEKTIDSVCKEIEKFKSKTMNENKTTFRFPSQEEIVLYLEEHPVTGKEINPKFKKEIFEAVAKFFADKEKLKLGIKIGIELIMNDLNEKLQISEIELEMIRFDLRKALKDCAKGIKFEISLENKTIPPVPKETEELKVGFEDKSKTINENRTLLHFPSQEEIVLYLEQHPLTSKEINSYLSDKKIIEAVAKIFAAKKRAELGVEMEVIVFLNDLNEKLQISETALELIRLNLTLALKDCANGKKFEISPDNNSNSNTTLKGEQLKSTNVTFTKESSISEKILEGNNSPFPKSIYENIKFLKRVWIDPEPEFSKRLNFNEMKKVFVHGSLMIGVYNPRTYFKGKEVPPYLLAYDMNTEKMVWGIPLMPTFSEKNPSPNTNLTPKVGNLSRIGPPQYSLKKEGKNISLQFFGEKTIRFINPETGEFNANLELPEISKDFLDYIHISPEGFAYQTINKYPNDRILIGGKIINDQWNVTFESKTSTGSIQPFSTHCGIEDFFDEKLVLFGPTGDKVIIKCKDAKAFNDKLYSIETDPKHKNKCVLAIRTLKTDKQVITDIEKTISLKVEKASIGKLCQNGKLVLFAHDDLQKNTSPIFIDLNRKKVNYSKYKIPQNGQYTINVDSGELWSWDELTKKVWKVSATKIDLMGSLKSERGTSLLHVDNKDQLYFVDIPF